jgi:hypothetical protein
MEDAKAGETVKFLLDTNVVSEIRKAKPYGGVMAWFTAHHSSGMAVPAVVLFEIQMGAERLRQKDPLRAAQFDWWAGQIAGSGNVLPLDAAAAREAARLLNNLPMVTMADAMIAAIAHVHGLTIATRNIKHFEKFGVPLVNPFEHR